MNPQNDKFRDFLGVTTWHKAGYTGKRVICGTAEDFEHPNMDNHAYLTYLCLKEIAPDCEVLFLPMTGANDTTFMSEQIETINEKNASAWFASIQSPIGGDDVNSAFENAPNCIFLNSIGNAGENSYSRLTDAKAIYGVGAYNLDTGVPIAEDYSSVSEYIDFCAPAGLWINHFQFTGTSCSAPVLCGMCALVNDFFIDKTGKPLSREMMYQFLKDHSIDFFESGKDTKTGWGYVVLPDPETIDIGRYAPLEITMQIGNNKMTVNGETIMLDQAPIIAQSGRTLAPVRAVFEAAGLTVSWDAVTKTITATR